MDPQMYQINEQEDQQYPSQMEEQYYENEVNEKPLFPDSSKFDLLLEDLQQGRFKVKESSNYRQDLFKQGNERFLRAIKREITVVEKTNKQADRRNDLFSQQIADSYYKSQETQQKLVYYQTKTDQAKYEFNNQVMKIYPNLSQESKDELLKNQDNLKNRLAELKSISEKNNYNYYDIFAKKYEQSDDLKSQRKKGEQLEKQIDQQAAEFEAIKTLQQAVKPEPQRRFLEEFDIKWGRGHPRPPTDNAYIQQQPQQQLQQQPQQHIVYQKDQAVQHNQSRQNFSGTNIDQYLDYQPANQYQGNVQTQQLLDQFTLQQPQTNNFYNSKQKTGSFNNDSFVPLQIVPRIQNTKDESIESIQRDAIQRPTDFKEVSDNVDFSSTIDHQQVVTVNDRRQENFD